MGKKPWAIILDYTPRTKKPPQTGYTIGHLGPIYNKVGNLVWKILLGTSWSFELFYKKYDTIYVPIETYVRNVIGGHHGPYEVLSHKKDIMVITIKKWKPSGL